MRVPLTTLLYLLPSLPLLSSQKARDRFATESRLVLVNATVLDAQNRVRTDLQAKDFSLYEDGQPVKYKACPSKMYHIDHHPSGCEWEHENDHRLRTRSP